mmetsp:Transcript_60789/g.130627  ORF Transcript_60789/g.130627 Transcript_60789/m.130627 type:complete len:517 (+) Transcript_60789:116-1666(+)
MPPDLCDDLVINLLGPGLDGGELMALVVREQQRVLIIVLLWLVAEAIPGVVIILVIFAEDVYCRVVQGLLHHVKVALIADVHRVEEARDLERHHLAGVHGVLPPIGVLLPPSRLHLPEVGQKHVQEDAPLGEANGDVERTILGDPLVPIIQDLWNLFVLDPCVRVELLVPVEPVSRCFFVARVHVPILELLPTSDLLLQFTDCGLPCVPFPILGALDESEFGVVLAKGHFQSAGLELDDRYAGVAAGEAENPQLPERHVLQVLQDHGCRLRGHEHLLRHCLVESTLVLHPRHDPFVDLFRPRLARGELVALVVQQDGGIIVILLCRFPSGSCALVVIVLICLPEDHDCRVWDWPLGKGLGKAIIADREAAKEDALPPRDRFALLEQLGYHEVHHQAALEHRDDHVNWPLLLDKVEHLIHCRIMTLIGELHAWVHLLEEVDSVPLVIRGVVEPNLEVLALRKRNRHSIRVVVVNAVPVLPDDVALQDFDVHFLTQRTFQVHDLKADQVLIGLLAVEN